MINIYPIQNSIAANDNIKKDKAITLTSSIYIPNNTKMLNIITHILSEKNNKFIKFVEFTTNIVIFNQKIKIQKSKKNCI